MNKKNQLSKEFIFNLSFVAGTKNVQKIYRKTVKFCHSLSATAELFIWGEKQMLWENKWKEKVIVRVLTLQACIASFTNQPGKAWDCFKAFWGYRHHSYWSNPPASQLPQTEPTKKLISKHRDFYFTSIWALHCRDWEFYRHPASITTSYQVVFHM